MKFRTMFKLFLAASALSFGMMANGNLESVFSGESILQNAEAKAVVVKKRRHHHHHRHPVRRVVRSAIYLSALPRGCPRIYVNGVRYWYCGGRYYDSYNGRYVVVYIK